MNSLDKKILKILFFITDFSFIFYWFITYFKLIPEEYLFKDYKNDLVVIWNWSFFPLDIFISLTGLTSIYFSKKQKLSEFLILISLVLTFCSGLQAISYWVIAKDFDLSWWIPNLYLLLYPIYFLVKIGKNYES